MNQLALLEMAPSLTAEPMYRLPVWRVQLVRDGGVNTSCRQMNSPADAAAICREWMGDPDREHLVCILLNTKNRPIGLHTITIGTIDTSLCRTADALKAAVLANATNMILAHNHPSGDPTPSRDDIEVTRKMAAAGKLLDITVLDHIILGDGCYRSLKEAGFLD